MEQKDIYELISIFDGSSLTELEIENASFRLHLSRNLQGGESYKAAGGAAAAAGTASAETAAEQTAETQTTEMQAAERQAAEALSSEAAGGSQGTVLEEVRAPLVGVYYAAPSPAEAPYVTEGQKVEKGQVLCLLEAMKMMNELKSPVSGIIRKIRGKNGELAEYDQVLFEVERC